MFYLGVFPSSRPAGCLLADSHRRGVANGCKELTLREMVLWFIRHSFSDKHQLVAWMLHFTSSSWLMHLGEQWRLGQVGDPKQAAGSWLRISSAVAIVVAWGVNQQVDDLSLSLCVSNENKLALISTVLHAMKDLRVSFSVL